MRTVIYSRISQDDGTGLGVARQEKDCRAYCENRGWEITSVVTENDQSAYGKRRPLYEAMLDDIKQGTFDALVVWHPDRLHRSPKELEAFIDVVEATGLTVGTVTAGDLDLATPDGRLTARIVGSVSRKESEDKSRRLRRKHLELAEAGKIAGGGRRPFGYEKDRITIVPSEAALIRDAAARVLAGESIRGVTLDWQRRGVETVTGASWQPTTIKRMLMSARVSGQREHHGRIVGPAEWPSIITPDDTIRLRAILNDPSRSTGTTSIRSYLATGMVYCARCDVPMQAQGVRRKGHLYRRHACSPDRGGCGRCGIGAQPLEDLIAEACFVALDGPALAARTAVAEHVAPQDVVAPLEARMDVLAEMFAAGEISRPEWATARAGIEARLIDARQAIAADVVDTSVSDLAGRGDELRQAWPEMSLEARRAVIEAVITRIVIAPTTRANNKFDAGRITIEWRL